VHLVFGVHGQLLRVSDLILGLFKREVEALDVPLYFFNPVDDFLLEDLLAVLQVFQLLLSLLGESSGGGVASLPVISSLNYSRLASIFMFMEGISGGIASGLV